MSRSVSGRSRPTHTRRRYTRLDRQHAPNRHVRKETMLVTPLMHASYRVAAHPLCNPGMPRGVLWSMGLFCHFQVQRRTGTHESGLRIRTCNPCTMQSPPVRLWQLPQAAPRASPTWAPWACQPCIIIHVRQAHHSQASAMHINEHEMHGTFQRPTTPRLALRGALRSMDVSLTSDGPHGPV